MLISDVSIYSVKDIIDALRKYEKEESPEAFEPALYFVSELTGVSVDGLMDMMRNYE